MKENSAVLLRRRYSFDGLISLKTLPLFSLIHCCYHCLKRLRWEKKIKQNGLSKDIFPGWNFRLCGDGRKSSTFPWYKLACGAACSKLGDISKLRKRGGAESLTVSWQGRFSPPGSRSAESSRCVDSAPGWAAPSSAGCKNNHKHG